MQLCTRDTSAQWFSDQLSNNCVIKRQFAFPSPQPNTTTTIITKAAPCKFNQFVSFYNYSNHWVLCRSSNQDLGKEIGEYSKSYRRKLIYNAKSRPPASATIDSSVPVSREGVIVEDQIEVEPGNGIGSEDVSGSSSESDENKTNK